MLKRLTGYIAKFLSTLLNNILATILVAVIGIPILVSWATGTLNILLQILISPTPLWATIALVVLCCAYIYLRVSRKNQNPSKELLYPVENFKWKVSINQNGNFKIDSTPYCKDHDLKLIESINGKIHQCPEPHCRTISEPSLTIRRYEIAKRYIEKAIRDKEIKC